MFIGWLFAPINLIVSAEISLFILCVYECIRTSNQKRVLQTELQVFSLTDRDKKQKFVIITFLTCSTWMFLVFRAKIQSCLKLFSSKGILSNMNVSLRFLRKWCHNMNSNRLWTRERELGGSRFLDEGRDLLTFAIVAERLCLVGLLLFLLTLRKSWHEILQAYQMQANSYTSYVHIATKMYMYTKDRRKEE